MRSSGSRTTRSLGAPSIARPLNYRNDLNAARTSAAKSCGCWRWGLAAWKWFISTATLIGSALATIAVGAIGHRYSQHRLLLAAALLMAATGMGFAGLSTFWPLLKITIRSNVGTSQTAKKSSTRLQRKS